MYVAFLYCKDLCWTLTLILNFSSFTFAFSSQSKDAIAMCYLILLPLNCKYNLYIFILFIKKLISDRWKQLHILCLFICVPNIINICYGNCKNLMTVVACLCQCICKAKHRHYAQTIHIQTHIVQWALGFLFPVGTCSYLNIQIT